MDQPAAHNLSPETFGAFARSLRMRIRLGLREFCSVAQVDPSNWSKIERGVLTPPTDNATLTRCAKALQLVHGTDEWNKLFDLANIDAGKIPDYVLEDAELLAQLPLFFRTLAGQKPKREHLIKLAQMLRRA